MERRLQEKDKGRKARKTGGQRGEDLTEELRKSRREQVRTEVGSDKDLEHREVNDPWRVKARPDSREGGILGVESQAVTGDQRRNTTRFVEGVRRRERAGALGAIPSATHHASRGLRSSGPDNSPLLDRSMRSW